VPGTGLRSRGQAAVGCASLPVRVRGRGCAAVLLGHVADAHECPRGGCTEPLIHV